MQWHEITVWVNDKLTQARERNDGDLDAIQTARLRGRIETLKELLALPSQKTVMEAQARFATPTEDSHGF